MDSSTFTVLIAAAGFGAGILLCWLLMWIRSAALTTPPQAGLVEAQAELAQANSRIRKLDEERQGAVKNYDDLKHQAARTRDLPDPSKTDTVPPPELTSQLTSLQAQLSALQTQDIASRLEATRAKSEALADQAQAKEYFRSLEKNQQLAAANTQILKLDAERLQIALEQSRKDHAQAAQQAAQVPALEARLVALHNKEQSSQEDSAESLKRVQARVSVLEQENTLLKRGAAALSAAYKEPKARPAEAKAQTTQLPVLEEQVLALQNLEKSIKKEFQLLAELQRNVTLTTATRHEFNDSPESRTDTQSSASAA